MNKSELNSLGQEMYITRLKSPEKSETDQT